MPRKSAKQLTLKEKEKWFVSLYIEAGAVADKIPACEKRTHLKAGSGRKIIRRKAVQQQIKDRMESVHAAAKLQDAMRQAADIAEQRLQEKLAASVQRKKIDLEVLDHELMMGVTGLDWNRFPKEKLDAIKAGYVVFGTLESGNTRRLIPPEHLQQNDGQGTYTALFNRLALKTSESSVDVPTAEAEVFDLIPGVSHSAEMTGPLPPPGEATREQSPPEPSDPNVITVEVG